MDLNRIHEWPLEHVQNQVRDRDVVTKISEQHVSSSIMFLKSLIVT